MMGMSHSCGIILLNLLELCLEQHWNLLTLHGTVSVSTVQCVVWLNEEQLLIAGGFLQLMREFSFPLLYTLPDIWHKLQLSDQKTLKRKIICPCQTAPCLFVGPAGVKPACFLFILPDTQPRPAFLILKHSEQNILLLFPHLSFWRSALKTVKSVQ